MSRRTTRRVLAWTAGVPLGAVVGMVLLSGSGQPVTAHAYPHWQEIAPPPLSPRTDPLGVHVGHWVLLLGGRHGTSRPRDGAAYDLRTGIWHRVPTPVALSGRDLSVAVGRAVVVSSSRGAGPGSWWCFDPGHQTWSRMIGVPARLRAPWAFAGALYALSGRRVEVYSTQLDRWTALPPDRLTPPLHGATVTARRTGTTVTGRAAGRLVADRWDGLGWIRSAATAPPRSGDDAGEVRLDVGGRVFLVRDDRAWIRLP